MVYMYIYTNVLVNVLSPRRGRGPWSFGHCCIQKHRKYRYFLHRSHLGAQNACSSPLSASGVLEWAAPAPARCPQSARSSCSSLCSVPPGRSKGLLEPPLGATRALEGAAQACSVPQDAPSGCSSLCSVPHVRSERHLEPLLGAAGGPRATSCVTGRSIRRSRMLLEESVLGYT